jgi:hypothetical protein
MATTEPFRKVGRPYRSSRLTPEFVKLRSTKRSVPGAITPNEVGRILGVSRVSVKKWLDSGRLRGTKDPKNGFWWIKLEDLKFMLKAPGQDTRRSKNERE